MNAAPPTPADPAPDANAPPRGTTIPRATYRLQLHADFGFDAASAVLPYLARLGISHVYCSPITRARPGSRHGYDVVDPAQINPELGGEDGFLRFAAAARAQGLGLLVDLVPNHMGVFGADNAWWMDVLENGPASPFAGHFDIDWLPPNPALHGKLLVPVLGAPYGDVLDSGEIVLHLEAEAGTLALRYHEHRFPLDPRTLAPVLRDAAAAAGANQSGRGLGDLASAFAALPARDDAPQAAARRTLQQQLKLRLAQVLADDATAAVALQSVVRRLNAPEGRDALDALHDAQAWRLAYWRMAADEINYRRFFDVNDLGALRIEDEAVFEAVQGKALDLAAAGWIDGFRIDHPDGLRDPAGYFERLQRGYARRVGLPVPPPGQAGDGAPFRPLYVVAEKIAAAYEEVPRDWALHGTTGYRFANVVNGLFVERANTARMDRLWRSHGGPDAAPDFERLAVDCKRRVARGALSAQLTTLTHALQRIALRDRRTRDYGFHTLRDALAEVAAAMPVYRTYVVTQPGETRARSTAQDRRFVDWAIAQARRRSEAIDAALFEFIRRCLLGESVVPGLDAEVGRFAASFQQFCAPVAAKGVEDTAFYRYHRLISLNEVGGDPGAFGTTAAAFHGASADRARHWPHTMLATSTHDNKRAEDVRQRINVLSERPAAWRLALRRWATGTRAWRSEVDGEPAPSAADQLLLHQTLLGSLPPEGLDAASLPAYRERIEAYMLKAAREAKQHTGWARPNEAYEAALLEFVRRLLGRVDGNPVLADLQTRAAELAWYGALNSLAMTVLKFGSPGVPDIYQGTELIDLSLVDPDNRRPVDYAARDQVLGELQSLAEAPDPGPGLAALAARPTDGRLKLWLIWRLLWLRRAHPALFAEGSYHPLRVMGERRQHAVAFVRRHRGGALLVVTGRRFAGLGPAAGEWPRGEAWRDTWLACPPWLPARGRDVLGLGEFVVEGDRLPLPALFDRLPFAAIHFTP